METSNIQIKSKSQQIYDYVKKLILEGDLKPGERIDIVGLSNELGISITPLKTAINKLIYEGFVTDRSRKGIFVTLLTKEDFLEYLEIRFMIEAYIIENTIENFDDSILKKMLHHMHICLKAAEAKDYDEYMIHDKNFHECIVNQSANDKLINIYQSFHIHTIITLTKYRSDNRTDRMFIGNKEHEDILRALEKHDTVEAKNALFSHRDAVIKSHLISDGKEINSICFSTERIM